MSAERDEAAFAAWWYTELKAPRHPESAEDKISEHVARAAWEAGQAAARTEVARLATALADIEGLLDSEREAAAGMLATGDAEVARLRELLKACRTPLEGERRRLWSRNIPTDRVAADRLKALLDRVSEAINATAPRIPAGAVEAIHASQRADAEGRPHVRHEAVLEKYGLTEDDAAARREALGDDGG